MDVGASLFSAASSSCLQGLVAGGWLVAYKTEGHGLSCLRMVSHSPGGTGQRADALSRLRQDSELMLCLVRLGRRDRTAR